MSVVTSHTIDLPQDRHIEVLEAGDGPALLCLHNAGGIPQWDGVLPKLAAKYTCTPAAPGYGRRWARCDRRPLRSFLHCFDVMEALASSGRTVGIDGRLIAAEMAALRPRNRPSGVAALIGLGATRR